MATILDTVSTDGRSLRRARNRESVLDAVIACCEDGDIDPSIDEVAERAGVSNRSIYRYFEHRDQLMHASVNHAMLRILPEITFADVGVGSFEQRVDVFVDHRLRTYQRLAPITRAAMLLAANEPLVAKEFESGRFILRQSFLDHFAEEFDPLGPGDRTRAVIAAELAFQFEALEFLWTATDSRIEEVRAILVDQLHLCLGRLRPAATR